MRKKKQVANTMTVQGPSPSSSYANFYMRNQPATMEDTRLPFSHLHLTRTVAPSASVTSALKMPAEDKENTDMLPMIKTAIHLADHPPQDDLGTEDPFRGRLDDLPCYKGNGHLVDGLIPSSKVFVDSHSRHFMPNNGRAVAPDLVILEDGYGLDPFNVVACIEVQGQPCACKLLKLPDSLLSPEGIMEADCQTLAYQAEVKALESIKELDIAGRAAPRLSGHGKLYQSRDQPKLYILTTPIVECAVRDDVSAFAIHRFITELKQLHQGWVHNDITPRHLALYGADQLGLIDFECCRKQGTVPEPALYTGE
eukprot:jgi/Chrzof1/14413/Cz09g02010.t1